MSVFIVAKAHIDALVTAAAHPESPSNGPLHWYPTNAQGEVIEHYTINGHDRSRCTEVGQMLWAANEASYTSRYSGPPIDPRANTYRYQPTPLFEPVTILRAIECFEYQTIEMEDPDWGTSEARAFCHALRQKTIARLPGYDTAPWEITESMRNP